MFEAAGRLFRIGNDRPAPKKKIAGHCSLAGIGDKPPVGVWRPRAFGGVLRIGAAVAAVAAYATTSWAATQSVANFYRGKQLTMLVGSSAGGGYDAYARLTTRHLGQFIPGHPSFIVQYLTGAGGAIAASNIYNLAPKDGTTIGMLQRESLLAPMLEAKSMASLYDSRKFNWVGSLNSEIGLIVVWHTAPQKRFEDLLSTELTVGSTGPATDYLPLVLNRVLHTKFKIVNGYPGSTDTYLAM
jgi:hypothetical protein